VKLHVGPIERARLDKGYHRPHHRPQARGLSTAASVRAKVYLRFKSCQVTIEAEGITTAPCALLPLCPLSQMVTGATTVVV
jgi:hypothetical protein